MEFALVLPILVLILLGLITFGSAFHTQLVIARAAEDGVRAVGFIPGVQSYSDIDAASIRDDVRESLAGSSIVPSAYDTDYATRLAWLQTNLPDADILVDNGTCSGQATNDDGVRVKIDFPYNKTRLLQGTYSWLPDTLTGCAVFQF
ncbi:TadE/TadG family type IV pilus assembly protein [Solimonas marina]|nr:TadE/TadG family type IV pilus assembly protein [Solimonas marina]